MAVQKISFKEWLKLDEVGTSTAAVASFRRPSIPMVRRPMLFGPWEKEDPFFRRKKKKKLDERQKVDMYHATTTGANDERIKSFQQGINPKLASGYGQGAGYYSYSGKEKAIQHAKSLTGPNKGKMRTGIQHSGNPMIVRHQAMLNPTEYELDKEIQAKDIIRFLNSNENMIDELLKKQPIVVQPNSDDNSSAGFVTPLTIYGIQSVKYYKEPNGSAGNHGVAFWLVDPDTIDPSQQELDDGTNIFIRPSTMNNAAELNLIIKELFSKSPALAQNYKSFVRAIMKRTAENRAKPRAWKYVGDDSIQPSQISIGHRKARRVEWKLNEQESQSQINHDLPPEQPGFARLLHRTMRSDQIVSSGLKYGFGGIQSTATGGNDSAFQHEDPRYLGIPIVVLDVPEKDMHVHTNMVGPGLIPANFVRGILVPQSNQEGLRTSAGDWKFEPNPNFNSEGSSVPDDWEPPRGSMGRKRHLDKPIPVPEPSPEALSGDTDVW